MRRLAKPKVFHAPRKNGWDSVSVPIKEYAGPTALSPPGLLIGGDLLTRRCPVTATPTLVPVEKVLFKPAPSTAMSLTLTIVPSVPRRVGLPLWAMLALASNIVGYRASSASTA